MSIPLEQAAGYKMMLSFDGMQAPAGIVDLLRRQAVGGFSFFRPMNLETPAQIRELCAELQRAAASFSGSDLPLVLATDQEGGQLVAMGAGTPFPGNLALGAAGSEDLSRRVGRALGLEMAAVGINLNYAPVCDVNSNPLSAGLGTRSFGENPAEVARLAAAMVQGIQSAGVAACAKHFPGHGDTTIDSHYGVPVVSHEAARLRQVEFPPFQAAIQAGARTVMTAHLALPAFNSGSDIPSTLSPAVLRGLLRAELAFDGVIISDALNMGAISQGDGLVIDCLAAAAAGVDLLLLVSELPEIESIYRALCQAAARRLLDPADLQTSAGRVLALKRWLARLEQPPLSVIGCPEHQNLALEVARASVTLLRDRDGLLPLRLAPSARIALILPRPADLTPADTSSYVHPDLAAALRRRGFTVDEFNLPLEPTLTEAAAAREAAQAYNLVIAGSINASTLPGQAALINALLSIPQPVVTVALRAPYDLRAYPSAGTHLCTYSIQPPSMEALAEILTGEIQPRGKLPVTV